MSKDVKNVLLGVVASIVFLVFVEPILGFLWQLLRWSATIITFGTSSWAISQIATGTVNTLPMVVSGFMACFAASMLLVFPFYLFRKIKKSENKRYLVIPKATVIPLGIFGSVMLLVFSLMSVSAYVYNTRFEQYMRILQPMIGYENVTLYRSNWAQMELVTDLTDISDSIFRDLEKFGLEPRTWWE